MLVGCQKSKSDMIEKRKKNTSGWLNSKLTGYWWGGNINTALILETLGGGGDQGRKFGLTTQMSPKGIGYGKIDRWWRCKALHEESFYLDVDSPVGHVFLTTHPINENIDDACRENIALHHWSASDFTRSVFIRDEVSPIGVARSANVSLHRDLGTTLALVLATAIRLSDLAQSGDPFR